jgi:head-tail adaptor
MQAGDLRSLVGFYKRPASGDSPDYGNPEGEFSDTPEFVCAANIKPRLGGEKILADRLSGTNAVNITVRRSSRTMLVDTAWRAKDERSGVIYNIRSVIDPDQGGPDHDSRIEMLCEVGVAT